MTDSDEKQRALDASMENEGRESQTNYGPMVQISLKEYDKMKERSKYITDRDLIGCIAVSYTHLTLPTKRIV